MPNCYIVLGCPRSGTSLLSGVLHKSGISMGSKFDSKYPPQNPTGFWENADIANLNQCLLVAMGGSHLDLPEIAVDAWSVSLIDNIVGYYHCRAGGDWGWKDPRCVPLWPLYRATIERLGIEPRLIITHRNPLGIARSWTAHETLQTVAQGLALAAEYEALLCGICAGVDWPRLHVAFEDWWRKGDAQRAAVEAFVGRGLDWSLFDEGLWRS